LRLLECFCDGEDDILILEYCEGGDVYELYAQNNGCSMAESFVSQLIRQILMALNHLMQRGVEHRDVKPENLLLYGPTTTNGTPHVKLADFGWASVVGPNSKPAPVPMDGVGSLWYAPPELNPPVEGVDHLRNAEIPLGKSDMWSVGIIAYLLLIGHSPFNLALRITDPVARETEVLRLAALGLVNSNTRTWARLSPEARNFISALIQPVASTRLGPEEAWAHKFIAKHPPGGTEEIIRSPASPWPSAADKLQVWRGLDGFQRLSWLSIARAVAEPELLEGIVFRQLIVGQVLSSTPVAYLEQLATELAGTAVPAWFHTNTAWADVLRLAFRYLDFDVDGVLGITDLTRHIVGDDAEKMSGLWLLRWQGAPQTSKSSGLAGMSTAGISFADFRLALWSTLAHRHRVEEMRTASQSPDSKASTGAPSPAKGINGVEESIEEAALRVRMLAIEEVCNEFIESEPTLLTFDMDNPS